MTRQAEGPAPLTFALLRLLADGEFHSGEAMAAQLGISRASVNLALRQAESYGLTLFRVRGRGYRLVDPPQWLDAAAIKGHLGRHGREFHLAINETATSSNSLMMRHMADGAPSGSVLAVEWQSAGRGRLGRAWHSGLGNALTFSLLWRFEHGLAALSGLSLAVGLAVIRALAKFGLTDARLKWPNDVLDARGAKLAGVLVEAQGDMLGPSAVVIGIGLNLRLPPGVSGKISRPASSLVEMGGETPDRNQLFAVLLLELGGILREFGAGGFAPLRLEWQACHAQQNLPVRLLLPDGSQVSGIARGVTDEGALELETPTGVRIFHAGEISLVPGVEDAIA
jgi:BirA family biotin operon repressor/biotin-[acetyl-CoA-carboxylase] ligase